MVEEVIIEPIVEPAKEIIKYALYGLILFVFGMMGYLLILMAAHPLHNIFIRPFWKGKFKVSYIDNSEIIGKKVKWSDPTKFLETYLKSYSLRDNVLYPHVQRKKNWDIVGDMDQQVIVTNIHTIISQG